MADETYTGEAYCVKCKEKREFTGQVEEVNNRRMAKGTCPVCGTRPSDQHELLNDRRARPRHPEGRPAWGAPRRCPDLHEPRAGPPGAGGGLPPQPRRATATGRPSRRGPAGPPAAWAGVRRAGSGRRMAAWQTSPCAP
ncbi:MAG: DUF5679 domain-containing protein [Candidatus Nanopelagicales bacterium]|nr:DUF5679 domain-containing protein [Candidatus Nanopelagicales bacterium]